MFSSASLTQYVNQSSWEVVNRRFVKKFSTFYGTRRLLRWSQEPTAAPYLMNPVHVFPYYFKISFNIVIHSTLLSPKWSLPVRFSDCSCFCISELSHRRYVSLFFPFSVFFFINPFFLRLSLFIFNILSFLSEKVGLWDHLPVCLSLPTNVWTYW
jgi:hypothetical protein